MKVILKNISFFDTENNFIVLDDGLIYLEEIQWLKNNIEPWDIVVEKWQHSSKNRLKYYKSLDSIESILINFPVLKQPLGYTLVSTITKGIEI